MDTKIIIEITITGAIGFGGLIWVYHYFVASRKNLSILKAEILGILRWLRLSWRKLRRYGVAKEVEGYLERSTGIINDEVDGVLPTYVKIRFVEEENSEEFFKEGTIVLRIKKSKDKPSNIINATVYLLERGFLKYSKNYLPDPAYKAAKLTMGKRIISEVRDDFIMEEYFERFIKPEFDNKSVVSTHLENMAKMEEEGVFTRMLLYEFTRLKKLYPRVSVTLDVRQDVLELIGYLTNLAYRGKDEHIESFIQRFFIAIGIILIARPEKIEDLGISPYSGAVQYLLRNKNLDRIYIMARGNQNITAGKKVGAYFEGTGEFKEIFSYIFWNPIRRTNCLISCYNVEREL